MHNKTEKFITQLHHATHGERSNSEVSKYQLVSQPKLDKFQLQTAVLSPVHTVAENGDFGDSVDRAFGYSKCSK